MASTLTAAASGLRALIEHRLITRKVLDWTDSNTIPEKNLPQPAGINDANIVTSALRGDGNKHTLVIDIDHPSWLVKVQHRGTLPPVRRGPRGYPSLRGDATNMAALAADRQPWQSSRVLPARFPETRCVMAKQTSLEKAILRDQRAAVRALDALGKHDAAEYGRQQIAKIVKQIKDRKEPDHGQTRT